MLTALPKTEHRALLLSDFDGTLTNRDFYQCALEYLDDPRVDQYWQQFQAGNLPMFATLQAIFASLPGEEAVVWQVAQRAGLEPRLAETVEQLRAGGWAIVVISHGCHWYISRLLEAQGVDLPIIANPGSVVAGRGLEMRPPYDSSYFSPETGIDKALAVEDALRHYSDVAFAGDSVSDFPAAVRVAPERRFARSMLSETLAREGMDHRRLGRWSSLADLLG